MTAVVAAILAALPNVMLAISAKLFTQAFMQSIIEKVLIYGLRKAADMTTNTLTHEIVDDVAKQLQGGGNVP